MSVRASAPPQTWPDSPDDRRELLRNSSNRELEARFGLTRGQVNAARIKLNVHQSKEARRRAYDARFNGTQLQAPAKILIFDIESVDLSGNLGYAISFGYKWFHEKKAHVLSSTDYPQVRRSDDTGLMKAAWDIMSQATMLVTWYGKGFDEPFLNTRMLHADLPPLPQMRHLDLYWTARWRLKLNSNRLASVQDFLELPVEKTKLNLSLWMRARDGTDAERKAALAYIDDHCKKDVLVLELAYLKLRPYVRNHPNLAVLTQRGGCPVCGSVKYTTEGTLIMGQKLKQRLRCENCSSPRLAA